MAPALASSTSAGAACSPESSRAGAAGPRRRPAGRGGRPRDRALLLRGRRGRRGAVPRRLRRARSCVDGRLDLWSAAEQAFARPAASRSSAPTSAPLPPGALLLAPARRRPHRPAGGHWPISAETVRANYERIRGELGPEVTIVAATKYVARRGPGRAGRGRDRGRRREPGPGPRGEARALRRRPSAGTSSAISRAERPTTVNELCELCHSLSSESAARRLEIPALVEVNLSGEESKSGIPERGLEEFLAPLREHAGPDDDAAARPATPKRRGRTSAACASWPSATACASCRWGRARTTAWPPTKARRWCGWAPCSTGVNIPEPWDLQTSGTARSSTSGSPRRRTTGTRTATSPRRTSSAPTASARTSAA